MANGNTDLGFFSSGPGQATASALGPLAMLLPEPLRALSLIIPGIFNALAAGEVNAQSQARFEDLMGIGKGVFSNITGNPLLTPEVEQTLQQAGNLGLENFMSGEFQGVPGVNIGAQAAFGQQALGQLGGAGQALGGLFGGTTDALSDIFGGVSPGATLGQAEIGDIFGAGQGAIEGAGFKDVSFQAEPFALASRKAQELTGQQFGATPESQPFRQQAISDVGATFGAQAQAGKTRAQALEQQQAATKAGILSQSANLGNQINAQLAQTQAGLETQQALGMGSNLTNLTSSLFPQVTSLGIAGANVVQNMAQSIQRGEEFNINLAMSQIAQLAQARGMDAEAAINAVNNIATLAQQDKNSALAALDRLATILGLEPSTILVDPTQLVSALDTRLQNSQIQGSSEPLF